MKKKYFILISVFFLCIFLLYSLGKKPAPSQLTLNVPSETTSIFSSFKGIEDKVMDKMRNGSKSLYSLASGLFSEKKDNKDPNLQNAPLVEEGENEGNDKKAILYVNNGDQLVDAFVGALNNISQEITVSIHGESPYKPNELIRKIEKETEGFYISAIFRTLEVRYESLSLLNKKTLQTKITLTATYHHSLEQENLVNHWVDLKILEWDLRSKSPVDAITTIHDQIIGNASYIDTVDPSEGKRAGSITNYAGISVHSPYSIIANEKGVCQAYASLFQKFCDRLNIPCRYIVGLASSSGQLSDHAWNKVQVSDKWYNIDLTWDDPVVEFNGVRIDRASSGFESKKYFLKSDQSFSKDHKAKNGWDLPATSDYH